MSLCDDLLLQARHLALLDRRKPKQANLRRAVSSAYYAIFHLFVEEASNRTTPRSPSLLASRVARSLNHAEMAAVCRSISGAQLSLELRELLPQPITAQMRTIARTFLLLQDARHSADYDLALVSTRATVLRLLNDATMAIADWRKIRATDEATVFLAALLFAKRWGR